MSAFSVIHTRAQLGIEAPRVSVEVHLSGGLPSLSIVGLPETTVKESRERVRSALLMAGFEFPQRRITINLAPADLPKEGGRFDLAIALGLLQASGQLGLNETDSFECYGELALSGVIRPVSGLLPAAVACDQQHRTMIVPRENADEVLLVDGLNVIAVDNLLALCAHLRNETPLPAASHSLLSAPQQCKKVDLAEVKGQLQARRALEVAAAGQHNLLFSGPPGSGKSMLAERLPGLLPALTLNQQLEVASIYSVAGLPVQRAAAGIRPFRAPHHTASAVALVGGGAHPRPGEISLAHQGVLFLDELPEFPRHALEVLREPLESGEIRIARAARSTGYPARFQLVAAMNPCPCGYHGDSSGRCRCTPEQIRRYQQKISGPLLDRIDIRIYVPALSATELLNPSTPSESSAVVRERVSAAYSLQIQRQGCSNRELSGDRLDAVCELDSVERQLLETLMTRHNLSARACHRLLRVARTLADLQAVPAVKRAHLLEALAFRGASTD